MHRTTLALQWTALALATSLILSLTGPADAQTPGGAPATSDGNTAADLRSNGDKADNRTIGSSRGGSDNPGGRPSDHNGTANTLGKENGRAGGSVSSPAPRP